MRAVDETDGVRETDEVRGTDEVGETDWIGEIGEVSDIGEVGEIGEVGDIGDIGEFGDIGEAPRLLAELEPGARAAVTGVVADGAPAVVRRLHDLGFTPGAVVEVVRRAPLRDPVLYRVKDYEVCLRRTEAARVRVTGVER